MDKRDIHTYDISNLNLKFCTATSLHVYIYLNLYKVECNGIGTHS